jgi:hypothetical protein
MACNTRGKKRNAYQVLLGKPEEREDFRRIRRLCENSINMHLKDVGCEGVSCINLAQRNVQSWILVNTIINFQVP